MNENCRSPAVNTRSICYQSFEQTTRTETKSLGQHVFAFFATLRHFPIVGYWSIATDRQLAARDLGPAGWPSQSQTRGNV